MKAIIRETNEVIEVKESWSHNGERGFLSKTNHFYYPDDLDIPEKEITVKGYVARDFDGELNIFSTIPTLASPLSDGSKSYWVGDTGSLFLPTQYEDMFADLDCKTVQEITITINKK